jgi:hypothetical protein
MKRLIKTPNGSSLDAAAALTAAPPDKFGVAMNEDRL